MFMKRNFSNCIVDNLSLLQITNNKDFLRIVFFVLFIAHLSWSSTGIFANPRVIIKTIVKHQNTTPVTRVVSYWHHSSLLFFADEFRSKVGCENDVLHLSCNPHSRVAIYSAQYGRTEYDSIQCPQPRGMKEESK